MASEISSSSETHNSVTNQDTYDDLFYLSNADHPGLQLTVKQFDNNNYINWSRAVVRALRTKSKFGFIDGSCSKLAESSPEFLKWSRCDNMVICWMLNSMLPEIADAFMYIETSRALWSEIAERFSQTNGPLIYQLKKEISNLTQENNSIVTYFNKMNRLMDELQSIEPIPQCACGAMKGCTCNLLKKLHELDSRNQLLQFLMGLNSGYDQTRGQILSMDPLPSVNRTYYILQQIEKQKQITDAVNLKPDAEAFAATRDPRKPSHYVEKKDQKRSKIDRFCDYCKAKGHTMDQRFKIHGYPDWYKGEKGKGATKAMAAQVSTDTSISEATRDSPFVWR